MPRDYYVPSKYRKSGFEVYSVDDVYEGFTTDFDEAVEHCEEIGGKVVDAKNRRRILRDCRRQR